MYNHFFGFRERPFRLVPDPAYLFLSKSHEEALAHLTYAISQGEGFVEITGEVGTGKTTLCRAFLDKLGEDIEVAYIFNPKLDALQLLKAVNDEFGIPSEADNIKALIDELNAFLLRKKSEKKKAVLLIDEAQNLSPEVLEQVRLLSNLETNTEKLLQIILVGQPELADTLDSPELRQLGQRITLACHLKPLTAQETREYIRHRIAIASQKPGLRFSRGAVRVIHRYSGGIPRLINIACDRALLTAFGLDKHEITGGIADAAIRELAARGESRRTRIGRQVRPSYVYALVVAAAAVFLVYHFNLRGQNTASTTRKPHDQSPPVMAGASKVVAAPPLAESKVGKDAPGERKASEQAGAEVKTPSVRAERAEAVPVDPSVRSRLHELLRQMDPRASRSQALGVILRLWNLGPIAAEDAEDQKEARALFQAASRQCEMELCEIKNDLELLRKLQLPSVLECRLPEDLNPRYLAVSRVGRESVSAKRGVEEEEILAPIADLKAHWSGVAYLLWKNTLRLEDRIPLRLTQDSVLRLKTALKELGFHDIPMSPVYDRGTVAAVRQIQRRYGLEADGVVGPLTKIVLHQAIGSLKPRDASAHSGTEGLLGEPREDERVSRQ